MEETFIPAWLHPNIQQILALHDEAAWNEAKRSEEMLRPCMMLNPTIHQFGDEWIATFGEVYGYGKTPEEAYLNFDKAWKGEPVEPTEVLKGVES